MQVSALASTPSASARPTSANPRSIETWQRCVRQPVGEAELQRAADRLALGHRRAGVGVRHRVAAALGGQLLGQAPHDVVVLGVEADERAEPRADRHRQQQLAVGHAREAHGVGLERRDLEGRGARRVQRRDLVQSAARRDRGVERDVHERLGLDVRDLLLEAREAC